MPKRYSRAGRTLPDREYSQIAETVGERPEAKRPTFRRGRQFGQIFRAHRGYLSDKWEQYLSVYERELRFLVARGAPLRLLEIGVQNGGSLQIWHKFLPRGSQITGIDIDSRCAQLKFPRGIRVIIGDATDARLLDAGLGDEKYDIIIDDGSHLAQQIIRTFENLFPRLAWGGKYFIEDLHTSYWKEYSEGADIGSTSLEFLKHLVDGLHIDFMREPNNVHQKLIEVNNGVCQISFYNSIVVLEKYFKPKNSPFRRVLSGKAMNVTGTAVMANSVMGMGEGEGFELSGGSRKPIIDAALHSAQQLAAEQSTALQTADQQIAQIRAELTAREAESGEALRRAGELQTMLDERAATLLTSQTELAGTQAELSVMRATATEQEQRLHVLADALASSQAILATLDKDRREQIDGLQGALRATEQKAEAAISEASTAQLEVVALREEVADLRHRVRGLDAAQELAAALRERLEEANQQAADSATARETEIAELKGALTAARQIGKATLLALAGEIGGPPQPEPTLLRRVKRRLVSSP